MSGFGRILHGLNETGVRYVLIGGIAVIRHGYVRTTKDVDAIVAQDRENLASITAFVATYAATRQDGSPLPDGWISAGRNLHLMTESGPLDLLAELPSPLTYAELRGRADLKRVDGIDAAIISLADLVMLKRRAGREQDLADLRNLEEAHGALPELPTDAG